MSVSINKEWLGESGYCNCLLVVMSRMQIPSVELASDQPPPNLETLTAGRPATHSWIRTQEFDYTGLDTLAIIEILVGLGGIKKSLWGYRPGTLIVQDCVENDGPVVKRKFHLRLNRSRDLLRLSVELESM